MNVNSKNIYHQSKMDKKDLKVKKLIEDTFIPHPAYGHRRLAIELEINKKKILRVMKKYDLHPPRLWYTKIFTTKPSVKYQDEFKNLTTDINNPMVNNIWHCNLTYLKFQKKFFYLSAIQDHVSNEIVSFNLSAKHDSWLTLKTIKEAVLKQGAIPDIFHFDSGKENLAEKCIKYLQGLGIEVSVSDPASPWQNHIESFFSRFKAESGDMNRFETLEELLEELIEFIYQYINYYNSERIVTRLKTSPVKYRQSQRICS